MENIKLKKFYIFYNCYKMSDQIHKGEKFTGQRKVNVTDKMDSRDCARLLDYYRMRVGKFEYLLVNSF
jgi:hypothetical protein